MDLLAQSYLATSGIARLGSVRLFPTSTAAAPLDANRGLEDAADMG